MGRKPCYNAKYGLNKFPRIEHGDLGEGRWPATAKNGALKRSGKSYRLRCVLENTSLAEEDLIKLHQPLGYWWSVNDDDDIKNNNLNTRLCKKAHANGCIGMLKSVRPTERNTAVSMTLTLDPNQMGEREEVTQPVG